jgi:hypothetical protein
MSTSRALKNAPRFSTNPATSAESVAGKVEKLAEKRVFQQPARAWWLALALCGCPGEIDDPTPFLTSGGGGSGGAGCFDVETELFPMRCATTGCHDATSMAAMLDLASPNVAERLVDVPATADCNGAPLIDPNDAEASILYVKLLPMPCGLSQMPQVGDKLTEPELACVLDWIEQQ